MHRDRLKAGKMLEYMAMNVIISFYIVAMVSCKAILTRNNTDQVEKNVYEQILDANKELSGNNVLFQGDIKVEQGAVLPWNTYNAVRERYYLWIDKTIPYEIEESLIEEGKPFIQEAMQQIESRSCVTFKEHDGEANWIKFVNNPGCTSSVGRSFWRPGPQDITLGRGCISVGTIVHELLHALGFYHEQSRPDRDDFIEIIWENIKPGEEHNFRKYDLTTIDTQEIIYDYSSIMHYGKSAYATAPDLDTIVPIRDFGQTIGQRHHLSEGDVEKLNLLYSCKEQDVGSSSRIKKHFYSDWTQFGPCNDNCYKEKQRFCSHKDIKMCPGADYYGIETEEAKCSDEECYAPVDGHWGRWSPWSSCSVTCDEGKRIRMRECNDPSPKYEGRPCSGNETDSRKCKLYACALGPDDCTFDLDKCQWNTVHGDYEWRLHKGPTPTRNTGPEKDHTNGDGYYMYTEASHPAKKDDIANITSGKFRPLPQGRCMSFWYHMYGSGTGTLNVYVISEDEDEKLMWSMSGDQGNQWKNANVELVSAKDYEVRFTAIRGSSYFSDIALDDIFFKEGSC